jgi:RNA polymerase sigma-70 factor (ECF subfamily)
MERAAFPSTRWSLVRRAGGGRDGALGPEAREAFSELCGAYWYPLFAYLRRSGRDAAEAADLVQGTFVSLLERASLEGVAESGARFRGWLLGALKHHAADEHRRANAVKRGGDVAHFPLDVEAAEGRYARELEGGADPAALFERAWAREVLAQGLERVGREYHEAGRGLLFDLLRPALVGEPVDREGAARALGMTAVALRVALSRLRARYRDQLVQEVRDTIGDDADLGSEVSALLLALGHENSAEGP